MKLNHDCVRNLLLDLEENLNLTNSAELNQNNSDEDTLYAAMKLIEADYLNGEVIHFIGGQFIISISSITWTGHQFLDNIRPKTSWDKTKEISSKIGGVSIKILSDIAAKVTTELINNQL